MFDHVKFGVSDYAASKALFLKALESLGVAVVSEGPPTYGVDEEAFRIFGVRPPRNSKADADAALREVDKLLPGEGSLAERAAAFRSRLKRNPRASCWRAKVRSWAASARGVR